MLLDGGLLNILIVTHYFWPEPFRITDLAKGLIERGHKVSVLTGKPNYPRGSFYDGYSLFSRSYEEYEGIRIIRIPLIPRGRGGSVQLILNFISFAASASIFGPFAPLGEFDLILVYEPSPVTVGIPAIVLKLLRRKPILFWVQDLWPETLSATGAISSPTILELVGKLVRFIYRHCDRILIQSEAFRRPVEEMGVIPGSIHYFPNTAEEFYKPLMLVDDAPERNLIPKGFVIMFAGSIGAAQDFPTILSAAVNLKHIDDIHWVILGDGRLGGWLSREIESRGLTHCVHMLGRYPPESMPRFFSLSDVLLVSLRRERTFSMTIPAKVQSYMACGKLIVASLEGEGARVIRESGAGFTVTPEKPDELSEKLLQLYSMSPSIRKKMGEQGRKYFDAHFERNQLLDNLEDWLAEVSD